MYSADKKTKIQEYPVIKDFGDDENFFRLMTEDGEVQIPKLPFQKGQPLPDTLYCRVKGHNGRTPILGHDMPRYVSEFYADGFSRGEEFEFRVVGLQDEDKGFYRLVDDNGLMFRLRDDKSQLVRGQTVKCRFEVLEPTLYTLRRSVGDAQLQMISLREIARVAGFRDVGPQQIRDSLLSLPEMEKAVEDLDRSRPSWVLTALRAARAALPRWFKEALGTFPHDRLKAVLRGYKYVTMHLLQGSGFLRNVKGKERADLQSEFTHQIEQADIYLRTLDIIDNDRQRRFIKDLLDNLKESGYIYHPNEQFAIMMILFQLSPGLVNTSLGNIFDTLMGWELETWKAEPFRQAFVEQLEIYIRQTCSEIDLFMQPESAADNEKIEKMLTAVAIQRSLYVAGDMIDIERNMSLFYRYLSLLRSAKAQTLLHKSYLTLLGVGLPVDFTWSDIKEPTMMMTRAAVDPPANARVPQGERYYFSGDLQVQLGPDGILVAKGGASGEGLVPNQMLSWPGLQVKADNVRGFSRQKIKSLDGHDEFWTNVETALFAKSEVKAEPAAGRIPADVGDYVCIEIDKVVTNQFDGNKVLYYHCRVVDDMYEDEEGLLYPDQLVNYNQHGVTVGTFRHDDGSPMRFDARVVSIDNNDRPVFSLAEDTRLAMRDLANTGDKSYCVITRDNGRSYSAISERGYGLYLDKYDDGTPPYRPGNVVLATVTGYVNEAVQGVVEEGPIDNFEFRNALAVHNILAAVAVYCDDDSAADEQLEEDDALSREDIREIVQILRYKALSPQTDIIGAFDYLSYARVLALVIGDDSLAAVTKAHKEILLQYQAYARNKRVFAEDIERIATIAPGSLLIQRLASRLQIVSALGHPEMNPALWDIVNSGGVEIETQLAQAVMSYNFLCDTVGGDELSASIKDRIASMLNVDSGQRQLKYYGSESQYVEFKSSLVYPARKGRSGLSVADPDKQEHEILHIIAGFMNSTGGVLYIGVNDDHYERGLDDDLTFYRMDGTERNTRFRRNIKSLDNLCNYLQNLIDRSFSIGSIAGDYAKASIDDESLKGVIMVKVDPCPRIVRLADVIYVRHSSKTEPLVKKEEIEMFTADRDRLYRQHVSANAPLAAPPAAPASTPAVAASTAAPAPAVADAAPAADTVYGQEYPVKTATTRNNAIHEWQDAEHFRPASYYIRFVGDDECVVTTDEWSVLDTDLLALNVHEDETDGSLVMVYDDEYAVRVPLRELSQKAKDVPMPRYSGRKLVFATVLGPGDGLYSLHVNAKNTLYERVTPLDRIAQGNTATPPERLLEAECARTEIYEGIPSGRMAEFSALLSTGMKRTQLGAMAKGINTAKTTVDDVKAALAKRLN